MQLKTSFNSAIELVSCGLFEVVFWQTGAKKYSFVLLVGALLALNEPARRLLGFCFFSIFLGLLAINERGKGRSFAHNLTLFLFVYNDKSKLAVNEWFKGGDKGGTALCMPLNRIEEAKKEKQKAEADAKLKKEKIDAASRRWSETLNAIGEVEEIEETTTKFKIQLDPLALFLGEIFPYLQQLVLCVRVTR